MSTGIELLEQYELWERFAKVREYVAEIEPKVSHVSPAAYRQALRDCNRVKAALGTGHSRWSVAAVTSTKIVRPGDVGFEEAERQWRLGRVAKLRSLGYR